MKRPDSLRRKIVVAYLLFALGVCTFIGVVSAIAIEGMEDLLVDEHLRSVAAWASPRHAAHLPVEMPSDVSFYHGTAIPAELRDLPLGVGKTTFEGQSVHLLVGQDSAGMYVVVDRASKYKGIERGIYLMLSMGFLGFVTLSFFLGRFIAHGFVTPITRLADAVLSKDAGEELPLLDDKDELGILTRAFNEHTTELRRFLARERFFTGDVSHELRTPLTVITGAAELLIDLSDAQPQIRVAAERILRAAGEATSCVDVLLLLARAPDALDRPATSLTSVIRAEVAHSQALVAGKPVTLQFIEGRDFSVPARQELLSCAIGNLIRNACQYTEQGSVTVRMEASSVLVEDTGPGLPESIKLRLRNQAPPQPIVGSAGSGLGLALVVRICEYLGAELSVENSAKNGSNFRINFQTTLTNF
jgi:signal transduction histidine kinase